MMIPALADRELVLDFADAGSGQTLRIPAPAVDASVEAASCTCSAR